MELSADDDKLLGKILLESFTVPSESSESRFFTPIRCINFCAEILNRIVILYVYMSIRCIYIDNTRKNKTTEVYHPLFVCLSVCARLAVNISQNKLSYILSANGIINGPSLLCNQAESFFKQHRFRQTTIQRLTMRDNIR